MRVNTVTWVDGKVLTKFMGELQRELMDWQRYAEQPGGKLGGDSGVLVAAITLRNKLDAVIEKSAKANAPKVGGIS